LVAEGGRVKTVLFLCTGNYYRSRFAEELFNHRAEHAGLDWIAQSRGLAIERGVSNVGPISPFALEGLKDRGLVAQAGDRFPRQCTVIDLEAAGQVVALYETEHRPLIRERFSDWENRVEYWQVADVEIVQPKIAVSAVDRQIEALLSRLRNSRNVRRGY
jgi:protein-tyrosine phosphatase